MWQQRSTNRLQLAHNEPSKTKEYDPFLHFAKRSKEVHREHGSGSQLPTLSQYDNAFWDKILQNPSEESFDPYCTDLDSIFSTAPAKLGCGHTGNGHCLEKLPSPAELMNSKRKRRGRGDAADRRAAAVTQHITELRRKQSFIDQLKGEKWWGSSISLWTKQRTVCFEGNETEVEGETHTYLTNSPSSPQMLDLVPGGNPMMSFVMAGTAHRELQRNWEQPCMSNSEFWGIGYKIEE